MRISDWSSDVCSSDLSSPVSRRSSVDLPTPLRPTRPVRSHWKWRSRLERTARPSGVDQPRLAMAIDGEEAGMNMDFPGGKAGRSEEHTSELQSLMRISYAVFCLQEQQFCGGIRSTDALHSRDIIYDS